jgi:uncharacterized protein (TIGR02757 family)
MRRSASSGSGPGSPDGGGTPDPEISRFLETVYLAYQRPEFISPDPLEIVLGYPAARDRAVAGLVCSSLAMGRVGSILDGCRHLLDLLGEGPADSALLSYGELSSRLSGFRYRFFSGDDLAALLAAAGEAERRFGSLESCFLSGYDSGDPDVSGASEAFIAALRSWVPPFAPNLLPRPSDGSACKRFNLFLRWMVRRDAIDPGDWAGGVDKSKLLVPLDTHLLSVAGRLGFLSGRQATAAAARSLTDAFRVYDKHDPVRFDFSLTRMGINPGSCPEFDFP